MFRVTCFVCKYMRSVAIFSQRQSFLFIHKLVVTLCRLRNLSPCDEACVSYSLSIHPLFAFNAAEAVLAKAARRMMDSPEERNRLTEKEKQAARQNMSSESLILRRELT